MGYATGLWVDDLRAHPRDGRDWIWAATSEAAITWLEVQHKNGRAPFELMSLDHDLGGEDTTRRVVLHLCENPHLWPNDVKVHSANPVGIEWLEGMIARYHPARHA